MKCYFFFGVNGWILGGFVLSLLLILDIIDLFLNWLFKIFFRGWCLYGVFSNLLLFVIIGKVFVMFEILNRRCLGMLLVEIIRELVVGFKVFFGVKKLVFFFFRWMMSEI